MDLSVRSCLNIGHEPQHWVVLSTLGKTRAASPGPRFRLVALYEVAKGGGWDRVLRLERLDASSHGGEVWEPVSPEGLEEATGHLLQSILDQRLTIPIAQLTERVLAHETGSFEASA